MYQDKNASAWRFIYHCEHDRDALHKCYKTVEYLNKQRKLLRMIEDHEISLDIFEEEYGNSEVFLRQKHVLNGTEQDFMENAVLLADAVDRFVERC